MAWPQNATSRHISLAVRPVWALNHCRSAIDQADHSDGVRRRYWQLERRHHQTGVQARYQECGNGGVLRAASLHFRVNELSWTAPNGILWAHRTRTGVLWVAGQSAPLKEDSSLARTDRALPMIVERKPG